MGRGQMMYIFSTLPTIVHGNATWVREAAASQLSFSHLTTGHKLAAAAAIMVIITYRHLWGQNVISKVVTFVTTFLKRAATLAEARLTAWSPFS